MNDSGRRSSVGMPHHTELSEEEKNQVKTVVDRCVEFVSHLGALEQSAGIMERMETHQAQLWIAQAEREAEQAKRAAEWEKVRRAQQRRQHQLRISRIKARSEAAVAAKRIAPAPLTPQAMTKLNALSTPPANERPSPYFDVPSPADHLPAELLGTEATLQPHHTSAAGAPSANGKPLPSKHKWTGQSESAPKVTLNNNLGATGSMVGGTAAGGLNGSLQGSPAAAPRAANGAASATPPGKGGKSGSSAQTVLPYMRTRRFRRHNSARSQAANTPGTDNPPPAAEEKTASVVSQSVDSIVSLKGQQPDTGSAVPEDIMSSMRDILTNPTPTPAATTSTSLRRPGGDPAYDGGWQGQHEDGNAGSPDEDRAEEAEDEGWERGGSAQSLAPASSRISSARSSAPRVTPVPALKPATIAKPVPSSSSKGKARSAAGGAEPDIGDGMGFPGGFCDSCRPLASTVAPRASSSLGASASTNAQQPENGLGFSFPNPNLYTVAGCGSAAIQRRILDITWQQTETLKWERRNRKSMSDKDKAKSTYYCTPIVNIPLNWLDGKHGAS